MLNLISCELLKLKRSKMVLISVAGVLSTPLLMLIEALQTHFDKPEIIFTLSDIYSRQCTVYHAACQTLCICGNCSLLV